MLMIEPAALGLDQPSRHRLRDEIGGAHVQRHDESKSSTVTSTNGAGRLVPALLTRMSNGCCCGDRCLHGVDVGDVEHERVGLLAARADRVGGLLDLVRGARGERHMRAGIGQRRCGREPDAAPGAGHQRALAVEPERGRRSSTARTHSAACA